jgi:hypothetical protein
MATVHLSPVFNGWQGFGNTGLTLTGGHLYTYQAGTGTPAITYTTSLGNVANSFPINLDSAGRPPAEVWLIEGQAYRFIVTDSLSNILAIFDDIVGIHDFVAGSPSFAFGGTITFTGQVNVAAGFTFTGLTQRFKGDFSNATIANRLIFQSTTLNGNTDLVAIPNGASTQSSFNVFNGTDTANAGFGHIAISNGEFSIQSSRTGAGAVMPFTFYCGNSGGAETMRLNTSGQLLIGTTTAGISGSQLRVAGLVQLDNAAAFHVTRGAAYLVASGAFTQLSFDTITFNQGSYFSVGSARYTPPAGKYALMVNAGNTGAVDQARWLVMIYKNGVVIASFNTAASGVAAQNAHIAIVADANGTDYFEGYVWQNSGGNYTLSATAQDTFFCGYRIG